MHCLDFQRQLLTEPESRDPEFLRHKRECPKCARRVAKAARFEGRLKAALEVEAPKRLAERILLRQAFLRPRRLGRSGKLHARRRRSIALAASVLLGFGVAVLLWPGPRSTLADEVITHIDDMSYVFAAAEALAEPIVANVFNWLGAELTGDIGEATFANLCLFRNERIAHLVLKLGSAPVTVMVMPNEPTAASVQRREGGRDTLLTPYHGGTLAVVGDGASRLLTAENRVREAVSWRKPPNES